MIDFDPYREMLQAYTKANRERRRITHWRINDEALLALAAHPETARNWADKPLLEREFLGIPLQLDRSDGNEKPALAPVIETFGQKAS